MPKCPECGNERGIVYDELFNEYICPKCGCIWKADEFETGSEHEL